MTDSTTSYAELIHRAAVEHHTTPQGVDVGKQITAANDFLGTIEAWHLPASDELNSAYVGALRAATSQYLESLFQIESMFPANQVNRTQETQRKRSATLYQELSGHGKSGPHK